jgi:hypothetical protein
MKASIDSELVSQLALSAGFRFSPCRCKRLASELDWLLTEASRIRRLSREGKESVSVFHPASFAMAQAEGEAARHE